MIAITNKLFNSAYYLLLAHPLYCSAILQANPVCSKLTSKINSSIKSCLALNTQRISSSVIPDSQWSIGPQRNMSDNSFKYESGTCSVAYVTVPDEKIAKKLAMGLVEQKLAACVNIIPSIQSIYMWEGKINEDNEYLMMIKTRTSRAEELSKWIRDNHPYSVAEVITLPIENGNPPYMKWLSDSVPDKK